jgi:hypothetical protein
MVEIIENLQVIEYQRINKKKLVLYKSRRIRVGKLHNFEKKILKAHNLF